MSPSSITDRLAPAVRSFTPFGSYRLGDDLDALDRVYRAEAPEAVVFYAARTLEALTANALFRQGLGTSASPQAGLDLLAEYNLLPLPASYWAHGLRRLGNDVRHLRRRLAGGDPDVAVLFVERWLSWFFCQFALGPHLPAVTADGSALVWAGDNDLRRLLLRLEGVHRDAVAIRLEVPAATLPAGFARSPVIPAAVIEMLLDAGDHEAAGELLEQVQTRFGGDLRLQQLRALYRSRTGDLEAARQTLEELQRSERWPDGETDGILAGVYKRLWLADPEQGRTWLDRSHQTYFAAWQESGGRNAYLGINAAATALWLDRPDEARSLAEVVRQLLRQRRAALDSRAGGSRQPLSYWDQVTLAEAELILGHHDEAQALYAAAFASVGGSGKRVEVARDQAQRIVGHANRLRISGTIGPEGRPQP
jgi:hypothetical protein